MFSAKPLGLDCSINLLKGQIMKKFFSIFLFTTLLIYANNYDKGKELFKSKCSSCHKTFVNAKKIKENFFKQNNKLLNLKAPTVNMMTWAINVGPNKIGEDDDIEFKIEEVSDFLTEYLYNPKLENSICDKDVIKYFKVKESMKGKVSKEELSLIAEYLVKFKPKK